MILATPKTGNTWLRLLMHYVYDLPIVEIPGDWNPESMADLPDRFVTHQHLTPSKSLFRWLVENRVFVITTVRHPADTFLSFVHFLKWNPNKVDRTSESLNLDGDQLGVNALAYVQKGFPKIYSLSFAWHLLGSCLVRYEDMLTNPLVQLRSITSKVLPVSEHKLKVAIVRCQPETLSKQKIVDSRHFRTATSQTWASELSTEIINLMKAIEPYASMCTHFLYSWDLDVPKVQPFDYHSIDPFGGCVDFYNNQPIGQFIKTLYFNDESFYLRWPNPLKTEGDSFWNWLISPCPEALGSIQYPPETLTNLMLAIYKYRPDLQNAFKDPIGNDRMSFLSWFIYYAVYEVENELPWAIVNYHSIDPFGGCSCFDNNQPIGKFLKKLYFHTENLYNHWPNPIETDGDSYWNWLISPCPDALITPQYPPETLTNLMLAIYIDRPDLQNAFKDPIGQDRISYLTWFINDAFDETGNELPWAVVGNVQKYYCQYLRDLKSEDTGVVTC